MITCNKLDFIKSTAAVTKKPLSSLTSAFLACA